jgi:hypothetical protein
MRSVPKADSFPIDFKYTHHPSPAAAIARQAADHAHLFTETKYATVQTTGMTTLFR